ncbi:MAG: hypothetical protein GY724_11475 [Actinomycetia bacterium]|nr:hypothetical protein [Actinomycetes bacterium]
MNEDGAIQLSDFSGEDRAATRYLDYVVAFRALAALGALLAAIGPAVMATADGTDLRGSVSAYWNVDPRHLFWLPFSIGAGLLVVDGILSFVSPNRRDYGGRWYNIVLGIALLFLTWFNLDDNPQVHYPAATVFFVLFIGIIAYTSILGWTGRHLEGAGEEHNKQVETVIARVSLIFLVLLLLTLVANLAGLISFFFFEVFALVNFALYYVQGLMSPFPYNHYEFPLEWVNTLFRALHIMRRPGS